MRIVFPGYKWFLTMVFVTCSFAMHAQEKFESPKRSNKKLPDSLFIIKYDTLFHVQTWLSDNHMEYRLKYNRDFELILAPNEINNLSFGISYRFLELGLSFSPQFLNEKDSWKKGQSDKFSFSFGFSMHRFYLSFDLTSITGFYLKNSADFGLRSPDSPFFQFPDLRVGYFSTLLRYNINPKFSTAALGGGTQVQKKSAWTILPSVQFATYRFHDNLDSAGVQNETTYSTDLNFLSPFVGTVVISPKFAFTMGLGPSFGVDFFKSVSLNEDRKAQITKGTGFTSGYTIQSALSYNNTKRFFAGFEFRYRSYGHKLENLQRLEKQYSYFQMYCGWRLNPPRFARKSLDWANKVSPVKFE